MFLQARYREQIIKKNISVSQNPQKMGSYEWIQWVIPIVPLAVEDTLSLKLGAEMLFQATWDYIVKKLTHSPTDFASQPLLEMYGKNTEALYDAFRLFLYTTEKQNRYLTDIALGLTETIEKLDKHYNETISDLAEANKTNVINFVQPILGNSCTHINNNFNNGFNLEIDPAVADVINSTEKDTVGPRTDYECIKITELNLNNGHCILEISGFENKLTGQISDPVLGQPNNIYSTALNEHKSIIIDAKPIIRDGEVIKLHISDAYLEKSSISKKLK